MTQQQCFVVTSTNEQKHSVALFRGKRVQPTCTCPPTVTCCHIMAAMMSIGFTTKELKELPNGTQLRANIKILCLKQKVKLLYMLACSAHKTVQENKM